MTRSNAAWFGIGAVAGSAVTALFFLFKEGIIFVGDDAAPVRKDASPEAEHFESSDSTKPISFKDAQPTDKSNQIAYHKILQKENYAKEDDVVSLISEDEYFEGGRDGTYDMTTLTLYSDGIIADSVTDRVMAPEDVAGALGPFADVRTLYKHFAYMDILFLRNEQLRTEYEVSVDSRTYKEVTG